MIKLNYKITRDDYILFNMSHAKKSKSTKALVLVTRFMLPILMIGAAVFLGKLTEPLYLAVFAVFSIPWIILSPRIIWVSLVKSINKILDEGNVGELFSKRFLTMTDDTVTDKTDASSSEYKWSAFVDVRVTESAYYLYTNSVQAIILPLREIKNKTIIKEMIEKNTKFTIE